MDIETFEEAEAVIESAIRAKVKTLDLSFSHRYQSSFIPDSIGNLLCLENLTLYNENLDIVYIKELPDTLGNLTNLKVLKIYRLYNVKYLPDTIGNLKNL